MLRGLAQKPLNLTADLLRRHPPSAFFAPPPLSSRLYSKSSTVTQCTELGWAPSLIDGCDYQHWLVVMERPEGYPLRDEIVDGYIGTLAMALGSEEEAKKSIYSVSTKYYYAFGCKVQEDFTYKIKCTALPNVKWVLPDSYLCEAENNYGGEPFIDGKVVPYEESYHAEWMRERKDDRFRNKICSRKSRRRRRETKKQIQGEEEVI